MQRLHDFLLILPVLWILRPDATNNRLMRKLSCLVMLVAMSVFQ